MYTVTSQYGTSTGIVDRRNMATSRTDPPNTMSPL